MVRHLKRAVVVFVVVLAAAQLVRPERVNPAIDAGRTIAAQVGTGNGLAAVLDRSCRDCHSNATEWRWYTGVAPVSWLMVRGVAEGRKVVNFSQWADYSLARQRALLAASCRAVSAGTMPGPYALLRPDTRLSDRDVETICTAARRADTQVAGGR